MMKMQAILLVLVFGISQAQAQPKPRPVARPMIDTRVEFGDSVVTHIADGGGWKTTITVNNLSNTQAAAFTLNFYGDDGNPKVFSFVGIGNQSAVTGALAPAASAVIKTAGAGAATQGWAMFDSSTSGQISGFAVFSNTINGNEAAVPFESWITDKQLLSFDNTAGFGMGVALVNANPLTSMNITAIFYDLNGVILGTDVFQMAALTHTAFIFSNQWLFTAGKIGTVFFEPDQTGLAILGLRYTPTGAFTSVASLHEADAI